MAVPRSVEVLACTRCGCTWLYQVHVSQYSTRQVAMLQDAVPIHMNGIPLLVCARCGAGVKQNVAYTHTPDRRLYDEVRQNVLSDEARNTITTIVKDSLVVNPQEPPTGAKNEVHPSGQGEESPTGN